MRFIFNIFFLFPIIGFGQAAFISGNDTICDDGSTADVVVSFSFGQPPYTFVYAINGINQTSITTNVNPYTFPTQQEGLYTLTYFSDSDTIGNIIGSALVTVLASPIALFTASPDTLSVLYTTTHLIDMSLGNIVNWIWDFGDNTTNDYSPNPYHTYPQWPPTVYQVYLIVMDDNGCSDTASTTVTVGHPLTSIEEQATKKELLKIRDLLGRETKQTNQPLFYIFDDGTVEKRIIIE
jgi:PKD repeat protein